MTPWLEAQQAGSGGRAGGQVRGRAGAVSLSVVRRPVYFCHVRRPSSRAAACRQRVMRTDHRPRASDHTDLASRSSPASFPPPFDHRLRPVQATINQQVRKGGGLMKRKDAPGQLKQGASPNL
jgi:hypothetical protein